MQGGWQVDNVYHFSPKSGELSLKISIVQSIQNFNLCHGKHSIKRYVSRYSTSVVLTARSPLQICSAFPLCKKRQDWCRVIRAYAAIYINRLSSGKKIPSKPRTSVSSTNHTPCIRSSSTSRAAVFSKGLGRAIKLVVWCLLTSRSRGPASYAAKTHISQRKNR